MILDKKTVQEFKKRQLQMKYRQKADTSYIRKSSTFLWSENFHEKAVYVVSIFLTGKGLNLLSRDS